MLLRILVVSGSFSPPTLSTLHCIHYFFRCTVSPRSVGFRSHKKIDFAVVESIENPCPGDTSRCDLLATDFDSLPSDCVTVLPDPVPIIVINRQRTNFTLSTVLLVLDDQPTDGVRILAFSWKNFD